MKYAIAAAAIVALLAALFAIGSSDAPAPVPTAPRPIQPAATPPLSGAGQAGAPAGFKPLASAQVKAAIHRALRTGETQRWIDGAFSGYAVPSQARGANGCRAVRYTIDQQPDVPFESITACE